MLGPESGYYPAPAYHYHPPTYFPPPTNQYSPYQSYPNVHTSAIPHFQDTRQKYVVQKVLPTTLRTMRMAPRKNRTSIWDAFCSKGQRKQGNSSLDCRLCPQIKCATPELKLSVPNPFSGCIDSCLSPKTPVNYGERNELDFSFCDLFPCLSSSGCSNDGHHEAFALPRFHEPHGPQLETVCLECGYILESHQQFHIRGRLLLRHLGEWLLFQNSLPCAGDVTTMKVG